MGLWDYLQSLASSDHPRIKREGQDFVASNPPGPVGAALRFFTQNMEKKESPNTQEILEARQQGIKEEIVWISPQSGVGGSTRPAPIAVAKIFEDSRGRITHGVIRDLTKPDQPVMVEFPEEVDLEEFVQMGQAGGVSRPDRARVFTNNETGERFATTQAVSSSQYSPARGAATSEGSESTSTRAGISFRSEAPRRGS